jgi:hypothetical protein
LIYMYLHDIKGVSDYIVNSDYWWNAVTRQTFMTELKLPRAGIRDRDDGLVDGQGSDGSYWSSSPNGTTAFRMYFNDYSVSPAIYSGRAYGHSVRCFKN